MKWDVDRAMQALQGETEALERVRREIVELRREGTKRMSFVLLGGLLVGLLAAVVTQSAVSLFLAVLVVVVGAIVVHSKYFGDGAARYRSMFKVGFVEKLVRHVEPAMNYAPGQGISEGVFMASGLYGSRPDRYSSEDLLHGMIGETKVMLSEVHAEEKHTTTDSKGNTRTQWVTIFKGIFMTADFNKEFRAPVSVMPDVAERHFGWIGKKLQKLGGNLQKLESPEFEEMFVVRGVDAVETRYILTPKMQESLVDLRKRVGDGLRVVFADSHVWLAIPNKENWFEGDLFRSAHDRAQAESLLGQLRSCFMIVEDLDLNTRIWTKD
ncbi:MAG: DUF3137 domain-containing protein [Verrucomicrobiaceae bacterium]